LLDKLAHQLALVNYDTKGEYIGYSSSSPTFTDNYVEINQAGLKNFNALPLPPRKKRYWQICWDPLRANWKTGAYFPHLPPCVHTALIRSG